MPITKTTIKKVIKPTKKTVVAKKTVAKPAKVEVKVKSYWETVGRRKEATARVRLYTAKLTTENAEADIIVNGKDYKLYFSTPALQGVVEDALSRLRSLNRFRATCQVKGGGLMGQAGAVRHGLSRALVAFNADFRKKLKRAGYLRRDPRMKERKKYGLKGARRAPQWSKR